MKKKLLLHAFGIKKRGGSYYLPYTHWIYVKEIIKYFDEVVILAACQKMELADKVDEIEISSLGNVTVKELPRSTGSYVSSIRYFFFYLKAYRSIQEVTTYYSRYPTPFGWLQKLYGRNAIRIVHYVGDPENAAKNNPNFSFLKKKVLIGGFFLEDLMYRWACRGAKVYTNGHHLATKLYEKGVEATPLISSTLTKEDFYYPEKEIDQKTARFIYLGYLRTAKGVETVIRAFGLYNKMYPDSSLVIIGSGEFSEQLQNIVSDEMVKNVRFLGKIEDRVLINAELRAADAFLFASLSEGSPRVVLESMANGLPVISTPVGSLPDFFKDKQDIVFANANDPNDFFDKMLCLTSTAGFYNTIRSAAYEKVRKVTIDNFIKGIFHD